MRLENFYGSSQDFLDLYNSQLNERKDRYHQAQDDWEKGARGNPSKAPSNTIQGEMIPNPSDRPTPHL